MSARHGYDDATYGERIAEAYDRLYPADAHSPALAVRMLQEIAGDGRVLELGIGTGRIALPLADLGVAVEGIDASPAMVERLRGKRGGEEIPVHIGSFATIEPEGPYRVVFVAFNTFFALRSQEEQVSCFRSVAGRLEPGGAFVIQAFVPDLSRFDRGQRVGVSAITTDGFRLDVSTIDLAAQTVGSHTVVVEPDGFRMYPVQLRYAWPAELDLMAQLAGLELQSRWSGWGGAPFGAESPQHVSVYRKPR